MKVLEIVPHFGFANSFLKGRMGYFQSQGMDMHLASSWDDALPAFALNEGISYMHTEMPRIPSPINDIKAVFRICRYIRHQHIDCVVGHADKGKLLACICGMLTRTKVILFAHGTSFEGRKGISRRVFVTLDHIESSIAQRVICVSPFLVELRLKEGIDRKGKAYLPNLGSCGGVDCYGRFNPNNITDEQKRSLKYDLGIKDGDFVIGFCGRLVKDKGIEELVPAFELMKSKYHIPAKMILMGGRDIRDFISSEVQKLMEEDPDIILTGSVPDPERFYSIMDLFILPTHRDGLGMCMLEAASMGVPVMTTHITGSRDAMVVGFNGEYIELDPADIASKAQALYSNPQKLLRYASNGRKWICENFENKVVWNSIMRCYESVRE